LYLGATLAFSSTVVVVKILSDKKEIDTLHGRIALGILIVEDFVAAIVLMLIPLIGNQSNISLIILHIISIIATILLIFLFTKFVISKFLNYLARNQETLFLFGIAWALILATLFDKLGFSLEIGALIAGMSLASSRYTIELGSKIKPLRDFFVILFFVFFGSQLIGSINLSLIRNAVIFSFFIIIGKPIIVMTILRLFGYKKRTNFLAGCSLAQISEFSLILALLTFNLGYLTKEMMSMVVLIAIITIGISSYSIYYSQSIFNKLSKFLKIFEDNKQDELKDKEKSYEVILFGYHRIGYKLLKTLKSLKCSFAIIDYNPKVIMALAKQGINCIYGDATDKEFLNEINFNKTKIIISTIPEEFSNLAIKEKLNEINSDAIFIATSEQPRIALDLYKQGIDYVIIPHHLGGEYAANMIKNFYTDKQKYKEAGRNHLKELKDSKKNSNFNIEQ
jgi:Kef-type K+ transport system membrane component KefB